MSFAARLVLHELVDSTMRAAREDARKGAPHGTTHLAREQSQGRGRLGRSWHAPRDRGLWMTTLLRPHGIATHRWPELSLVAGVAVARALGQLGATELFLKWPNDLVARGKKLGGLLLESETSVSDPLVLVGIGVNLAPAAQLGLPPPLAETCIGAQELGVTTGAHEVAQVVLRELEAWYAGWAADGAGEVLAAWAALDALRHRRVRFVHEGATVEGVAQGVNEGGELCVTTESGTLWVRAGEVNEVRAMRGEP